METLPAAVNGPAGALHGAGIRPTTCRLPRPAGCSYRRVHGTERQSDKRHPAGKERPWTATASRPGCPPQRRFGLAQSLAERRPDQLGSTASMPSPRCSAIRFRTILRFIATPNGAARLREEGATLPEAIEEAEPRDARPAARRRCRASGRRRAGRTARAAAAARCSARPGWSSCSIRSPIRTMSARSCARRSPSAPRRC